MTGFKIVICCLISILLFSQISNNLDFFQNLFNKILNNNQIKNLSNKFNYTIINKNSKDSADNNNDDYINDDDEYDEDFNATEETMNIIDSLHNKLLSKSNQVYLDIKIDNKFIGKLIFDLNENIVPKTCENFIELCKNKAYKNNKFHRLVNDFCIQGGDITKNNGTGGISIYGHTFDDENFKLKHDDIGILSMANSGPNTNNSQFFITFESCPFLDGKHVVFGKISSGINILHKINTLKSKQEKPINDIIISDCGLI